MRELIWKCLAKARALDMLIEHGFCHAAISDLAYEVAKHLQDLLEMYDRSGFEEREGDET